MWAMPGELKIDTESVHLLLNISDILLAAILITALVSLKYAQSLSKTARKWFTNDDDTTAQ